MHSDTTSHSEYCGYDSMLRGGQEERRSESLSMDTAFELLTERRRRFVLYHLVDTDGPVDFETLVDRVVDWETGDLKPPRGHETRVSSSLHHTHLQRLEAAGVVSYDSEAGLVRYLGSEKLEAQLSGPRSADLP